jgi:alpha-tubulin suppressor-like RCC1 family protein
VLGGFVFHQIRAGGSHSCALTATGEAYCWGKGDLGQLGVGGSIGETTPAEVSGTNTWASGG